MSATRNRRLWLLGSASAAVLIATAGWFAVINPQLSATAELHTQTDEVIDQNTRLQITINGLKRQSRDLPALTATLRAALEALPYDSGLPALTRQLTRQAGRSRITLTAVAVGGIGPVADTASTPAPSAAGDTTGTRFAIPVTLISTGSAQRQLAFLRAIQVDGPRRALVTSTQLAPLSGAARSITTGCTMTTQLTVFTAPLTPQARAQLEKLLSGDISG